MYVVTMAISSYTMLRSAYSDMYGLELDEVASDELMFLLLVYDAING